MRLPIHKSLDGFRVTNENFPETNPGDQHGLFRVIYLSKNDILNVMSSGSNPDYSEWEHVSVSLPHRCPTWEEMCYIKELFWSVSETVIQFHPKKSEYKNDHQFCLHLWKRIGVDHQLPPQGHV